MINNLMAHQSSAESAWQTYLDKDLYEMLSRHYSMKQGFIGMASHTCCHTFP